MGNLPAWAEGNPVQFFTASDQYERGGLHRGGRTATQVTATLPRALTHAQHEDVIERFLQGQLGAKHAYVWGIHETVASDGQPRAHVHIAFSEREDTGAGYGPAQYFSRQGYQKDRTFNDRGWPGAARQAWSDTLNVALELAGSSERVSARSFRDQGLDWQPAQYITRQEFASKEGQERLRQRVRTDDTPAALAKRVAEWEARKQVLGLTPTMSHDEIVQRIGDASREAIAAHQAQRRALRQELGSDAGTLARRLTVVQEQQATTRQLARDEAHYVRHPEQPRTAQHVAAVARLLQSATEEEAPHRRMRRRLGRDEDEQGQRRGYGYGR
jgi:hypothetical protein